MVGETNRRYFEDFAVGERFDSPSRLVSSDDLAMFARLTGESNPLHVDPEYAATTRFGRLVASGTFGLSLAMALFDELGLFHETAVAAVGIDGWRYHKPLLVDTVVHATLTVASKRSRRAPGEGIIVRAVQLFADDGTLLQSGTSPIIVLKRDQAGASMAAGGTP